MQQPLFQKWIVFTAVVFLIGATTTHLWKSSRPLRTKDSILLQTFVEEINTHPTWSDREVRIELGGSMGSTLDKVCSGAMLVGLQRYRPDVFYPHVFMVVHGSVYPKEAAIFKRLIGNEKIPDQTYLTTAGQLARSTTMTANPQLPFCLYSLLAQDRPHLAARLETFFGEKMEPALNYYAVYCSR